MGEPELHLKGDSKEGPPAESPEGAGNQGVAAPSNGACTRAIGAKPAQNGGRENGKGATARIAIEGFSEAIREASALISEPKPNGTSAMRGPRIKLSAIGAEPGGIGPVGAPNGVRSGETGLLRLRETRTPPRLQAVAAPAGPVTFGGVRSPVAAASEANPLRLRETRSIVSASNEPARAAAEPENAAGATHSAEGAEMSASEPDFLPEDDGGTGAPAIPPPSQPAQGQAGGNKVSSGPAPQAAGGNGAAGATPQPGTPAKPPSSPKLQAAAPPVVFGAAPRSPWKTPVICMIVGLVIGFAISQFDWSGFKATPAESPEPVSASPTGPRVVLLPNPFADPPPSNNTDPGPVTPPIARPPAQRPTAYLAPAELAKRSREALNAALKYLAQGQSPDGSYSGRTHGAAQDYRAGLTGLAILAFVGDNHNESTGAYRSNVRKAVDFLISQQDSNGKFSPNHYEQAIGTLALCETSRAGGLPSTRTGAEAAMRALLAGQRPGAGWDYTGDSGSRSDTSVTSWCAYAVASARMARFSVPTNAFDGVRRWLDAAQDLSDATRDAEYAGGRVAYAGDLRTVRKGDGTLACTAAGAAMRMIVGVQPDAPAVVGPSNLLIKSLPVWDPKRPDGLNYYLWFHGTRVMAARRGRHWDQWGNALGVALLAGQTADGPQAGSFPAIGGGEADKGGRIMSTAIAAMCLECVIQMPPGAAPQPTPPPDDPDVF